MAMLLLPKGLRRVFGTRWAPSYLSEGKLPQVTCRGCVDTLVYACSWVTVTWAQEALMVVSTTPRLARVQSSPVTCAPRCKGCVSPGLSPGSGDFVCQCIWTG